MGCWMERLANEKAQIWLDLGLSRSQATVYLTLSKLGQAKAKDIRKFAQVARQDVYRILNELVELGIVERVVKNPREFRALPSTESVEILLNRVENERQQKVLALRKETAQFIKENVTASVANPHNSASEFSLSEGEASLLKLRKAMEQSKSTVELIVAESIVLKDSAYFEEAIEGALRRGVIVRVLLTRNAESTPLVEAQKTLQRSGRLRIRTISRLGLPSLEIYDGKEAAFVALSKLRMGAEPWGSRPPMLWTNNPSFVSTLREYFESVWQQADDLS